jgi:hypothetical protein
MGWAAAIAILAWLTWKPGHAQWLHDKAAALIDRAGLARGGQ